MPAAAPRPGRPGPGDRLYRQGPWLIGHDGRARAEAAADEVLRACEADEVGAEIVRLESALVDTDVAQFPGLIVITNPEPGSMSLRVELAESIDVASAYRSRRPRGLADLHAGRVPWWRAGVTQVVTSPELRERYEGAELLDLACRLHDLEAWNPEDLFEAYTPPADMTSPPGIIGLGVGLGRPQTEALWSRVRPWGIRLDEVGPLLEAIERTRRVFRSPRKNALSRPISGSPLSRLDYVLDQPGFDPRGQHRPPTWSDDGGRVVREAVKMLQKDFPNLARPGKDKNSPGKTKGSTVEFRELYRNLERLALYLTITPADQRPADP